MTNTNTRRAAAAAALASCSTLAMAQITPEKTYYGVDRRIEVRLEVPQGMAGEPSIHLMSPLKPDGTADTLATAAAEPGTVDLAAMFPTIWSPAGDPGVRYAQLFVGEEPVGPALVLQPMLTPSVARNSNDPRQAPVFGTVPQRTYSGLRAYVDQDVELETTFGRVVIRLRPDHAPNTAWNFRSLVEGGFYEDILFHRIIDDRPGRDPFVVQVGDPTGTGTGGPGYFIDLEDSKLPHDFGVLSMARSQDPNSNGSQVFLCLSRNGTSFLDGRYTTFGQAIAGAEAIRAIAEVPVDGGDRPVGEPMPKIISARLVDAAPHGTGQGPVENPLGAGR